MRAFQANPEMKPNEVIEVALPKLEREMGPFAGRSYAIRIRPRQVQ